MDVGLPEILLVIVIIVLLFGPGRIQKVLGEMGQGLKSFRDGTQGKPDEDQKDESKDDSSANKKMTE